MTNVQTVLGPLEPSKLGITRMHEHLLCDVETIPEQFGNEPLDDLDLAIAELAEYTRAGGQTVVEATVPAQRRDPEGLALIALATGAQIVMGCGWYRQPYYPPEIDTTTVRDLAATLAREIEEGVGPSRIRPGIIGEIGSHKGYLTAQEERVFRSCARAALATGLPVSTHAERDAVGLEQIEVMHEEGLDPSRMIIGHSDEYLHIGYHRAVVRAGATVQFDQIGAYRHSTWWEDKLCEIIITLVREGFRERIVLSSDVCRRFHLKAFGGQGYGYLLDVFVPKLQERGLTDADVAAILVDNPRRLLEPIDCTPPRRPIMPSRSSSERSERGV